MHVSSPIFSGLNKTLAFLCNAITYKPYFILGKTIIRLVSQLGIAMGLKDNLMNLVGIDDPQSIERYGPLNFSGGRKKSGWLAPDNPSRI